MNVIVTIPDNGKPREAIPVRAIPWATSFSVSPDVVAEDLAKLSESWYSDREPRLKNATAYYLIGSGKARVMAPKEWDAVVRNLSRLSSDLKEMELKRIEGRRQWEIGATEILPARTFLWKDEFELAYRQGYGSWPQPMVEKPDESGEYIFVGREGDRGYTYDPIIRHGLETTISEGFDETRQPPEDRTQSAVESRESTLGLEELAKEIPKYIPYSRALVLLRDRLKATAAEVAAWVWTGPEDGGLCAYRNVNELTEPPRFFFGDGFLPDSNGADYLDELAKAWFRQDDIAGFEPTDRFITGAELRNRWSQSVARFGISLDAYVRAKIEESRLMDFHPIMGGTQWSTDEEGMPPKESALFVLAHVEAIEKDDGIEPGALDRRASECSMEPLPLPSNPVMASDTSLDAAYRTVPPNPPKRTRKTNITRAVEDARNNLRGKSDKEPSADEVFAYLENDDETGHIVDWKEDAVVWQDTKGKCHDTTKKSVANLLSRIRQER